MKAIHIGDETVRDQFFQMSKQSHHAKWHARLQRHMQIAATIRYAPRLPSMHIVPRCYIEKEKQIS